MMAKARASAIFLAVLPLLARAQYPTGDSYVECVPEQHANDMRENKDQLVVATWNMEWCDLRRAAQQDVSKQHALTVQVV